MRGCCRVFSGAKTLTRPCVPWPIFFIFFLPTIPRGARCSWFERERVTSQLPFLDSDTERFYDRPIGSEPRQRSLFEGSEDPLERALFTTVFFFISVTTLSPFYSWTPALPILSLRQLLNPLRDRT